MNIHAGPWQSLKHSFPIRKSEWAMAAATVCFWLVFSLRENLFLEYSGYQPLLEIAPQWVWGWFCFIIGVGRCAALFVNGAYWRSPHARAAGAFLNCYLWFQLTAGLASNVGLGMIFAGTFFIIDALNFKQAFVEAAASEGFKNAERSYNSARRSR